MKPILIASAVLFLSLGGLGGCASNGGIDRQNVGLVAGGIAGGAVGNVVTGGSTLGTIGGAVGGALLGREIAKNTD